ncbi:hypothetical protein HXX01_02305 [Candidatus Nomurabacteria bacterium]|nr:hypothetical protein [Candidatus Nomurabacteria bacterium]
MEGITMCYFVNSSDNSLGGLKGGLGSLPRREFFEKLNSNRPNLKCGANLPIYNTMGELLAVRCNCDRKVYHPIAEDRVIWWKIITPRNLLRLRQLSVGKALAILQE